MVEITSCIRDRCADVLWFEVREIRQDFLLSRPIRKHVEDVLYTNTHSPNARTAAAFAGLDANTLKQIRFHVEYLDILDICRQVAPWILSFALARGQFTKPYLSRLIASVSQRDSALAE